MKKIFVLFLFLLSCSQPQFWRLSYVASDCPEFNSTLLASTACNRFSSIEVQFLKGEFGLVCYLNVFTRQIPPLAEDPKQAIAVIEIDKELYPFKSVRMQGNQRVLLPPEAAQLLLQSIHENRQILVHLDGFVSKLEQGNFAKLYPKFF